MQELRMDCVNAYTPRAMQVQRRGRVEWCDSCDQRRPTCATSPTQMIMHGGPCPGSTRGARLFNPSAAVDPGPPGPALSIFILPTPPRRQTLPTTVFESIPGSMADIPSFNKWFRNSPPASLLPHACLEKKNSLVAALLL